MFYVGSLQALSHNINDCGSDFVRSDNISINGVPQHVEAYNMGESLGREFAQNELGLQQAGWVNLPEYEPWNPLHNEFGSGFDDVLQDSGSNLWIAEYKGGTAELSSGQMSSGWVNNKIIQLERAGHPMAGRLRTAYNNGTLRGVAIKTPWAPSATGARIMPGETFELGRWRYP